MNIYEKIEQLIKNKDKVIIAIDGPSAAGKSTFSKALANKYQATLFHTDNYFLPENRKIKSRLNQIGGNVDYERIQKEIFDNILGSTIKSNRYNCKLEILEIAQPVIINQVIIIEGVYSMHPLLINNYDLLVYLDIEPKQQLKRIKERNGSTMLEKWINEWIPLENIYFQESEIKIKADYIINIEKESLI
ncbi:MAG: (d)CMP kinase [Candidatus Izemoplasma sp.]